MYLYDQDRTSGVSLGIGRLGDFGNSSKKTKPDPAKAIQLEGEINNLYAKARWSGVERNYEDWLKVRDENDPSKWSIHKKAAHAAMMLGKAHSRYTRLWTARSLLNLAQGASEERDLMNGQIKRLGDYWAHVGIHLTRGSDRSLVPKSIAATDGVSQAIALAKKELADEGKFNNFLPLGDFIISGQQIRLKDEWAWSRVWAVHLYQKKDGSFSIQLYPREPTSVVDPPLHLR